ncbi:hypothetical protein AB1N83_007832 [Pleurotus pulmonarius]
MDILLPVPVFSSGFTTFPSLGTEILAVVGLTDECLGVHKITRRTTHQVVEPPKESQRDISCSSNGLPPPNLAWEAKYPKGSINPSAPIPGGFGFYLSGPSDFLESLRCGAQEVLFSYRMMLSDDWDWMKGGKLPDGGVGDQAYGCTGGRKENRCNCFDLRPMWRAQAIGELYTYLPLTPNNEAQLAAVPPYSRQNADYGFSVGRGSFCLDGAVEQWIALAFRVKLNDVGLENGEIQFWVNGVSAISVTGLTLRTRADSVIQGMHFQTFFGGHTPDWASPKDQFVLWATSVAQNIWPPGEMASRLTTIHALSGDCRFDPCGGHLFWIEEITKFGTLAPPDKAIPSMTTLSTSTLSTSRHLALSRKFLHLLTSGDLWEKWSQHSSSDNTNPNAILDRYLYLAYNMRARTPDEQEQMAWKLLLQQSIRQCIFGEENRAHTVWLNDSTEDVDNQVFCFRHVVNGRIGFILWTFDEPGRSRRALRDLYVAQNQSKFIPIKDVLEHVEVSYVKVGRLLHFPFVLGLVFRTDRRSDRTRTLCQRAVKDVGLHTHTANEDEHESEQEWAPVVLLTDSQRRKVVMDNIPGSKGQDAEYYESDTTPVSEHEQYFSSGDDTLAAGSGLGSSTHSFFSGKPHASGTVHATEEENVENKYEIHDGDDVDVDDDDDFGVPASGDAYHDNDNRENDEINEDIENTNKNEGWQNGEVEEYVEMIAGADEFGRRSGPRFGRANHANRRPLPPIPPVALKRPPSKKVLRALRTVFGISQ